MLIKEFKFWGLISIVLMFLLSSCTVPGKKQVDYRKYKVITSLTNNDYKTAVKILHKMFQNYNYYNTSQKCDYHYLNGSYYYSINKFDEALAEYDKCLELNDDYVQAIYSRAQLQISCLINYNSAILDYERILMILDYSEENNQLLGNSLITIYTVVRQPSEVTLYNKQRKFITRSMEADLLRNSCKISLANLYYKTQEYRKAINLINPRLTLWIENKELSKILAECFFELQEYKNAIEVYGKYLVNHGDERYIHYKIGLSYFFLELYDSCKTEMDIVLKDYQDIEAAIIDYLLYIDDQDILKEQNERALQEHKSLSESALFHRARCLGKMKKYEEAIADLSEIIELNPAYIDAFYYRGYYYNYNHCSELALSDFLKVIRLDPNRYSINYSIALIYDSIGRFDLAVQYYEAFITHNVEDKTGKLQVATKRLAELKQ